MTTNITFPNTVTQRPASVVRVHGYGFGVVCPQAAVMAGSLKRRTGDAVWATATPGSPWSPPVT